ncbi:MAG: four helix bundle protein [Myxococcales bacterium]|nr:four helix bundle protein [Myxococcales bacterium]
MPLLADQKLDVYRRAIEFLALASQIATSAPRGNSVLAEELKRAALSIPWNIAEEDTPRQAMELLTRIVEMLTRRCRRGDPPRASAPESTTTTTTTTTP